MVRALAGLSTTTTFFKAASDFFLGTGRPSEMMRKSPGARKVGGGPTAVNGAARSGRRFLVLHPGRGTERASRRTVATLTHERSRKRLSQARRYVCNLRERTMIVERDVDGLV